jgi:hypothetical protein
MNLKASNKTVKEINITGRRDPRGPDNTIKVWLDKDDKLHIQVQKPIVRCYPFKKVIENDSFIEVIQS